MEAYSPVPEDAEKEPREARLARLQQHEVSEKSSPSQPSSLVLTVALVALVASRSVDQVLFYRLNYAYAFYVFYFGAVVLPVAFLVITVPSVNILLRRTRTLSSHSIDPLCTQNCLVQDYDDRRHYT